MPFLSVEKAGRRSVVDAWKEDASPGTEYGRQRVPPGTTSAGIAGYYLPLLRKAGWTDEDFEVAEGGATLCFRGVTRLDAGVGSPEVEPAFSRTPDS